ncbi:hypothetical protein JCM8547_003338 [Rhodosporidiobolus lusitaniae]
MLDLSAFVNLRHLDIKQVWADGGKSLRSCLRSTASLSSLASLTLLDYVPASLFAPTEEHRLSLGELATTLPPSVAEVPAPQLQPLFLPALPLSSRHAAAPSARARRTGHQLRWREGQGDPRPLLPSLQGYLSFVRKRLWRDVVVTVHFRSASDRGDDENEEDATEPEYCYSAGSLAQLNTLIQAPSLAHLVRSVSFDIDYVYDLHGVFNSPRDAFVTFMRTLPSLESFSLFDSPYDEDCVSWLGKNWFKDPERSYSNTDSTGHSRVALARLVSSSTLTLRSLSTCLTDLSPFVNLEHLTLCLQIRRLQIRPRLLTPADISDFLRRLPPSSSLSFFHFQAPHTYNLALGYLETVADLRPAEEAATARGIALTMLS